MTSRRTHVGLPPVKITEIAQSYADPNTYALAISTVAAWSYVLEPYAGVPAVSSQTVTKVIPQNVRLWFDQSGVTLIETIRVLVIKFFDAQVDPALVTPEEIFKNTTDAFQMCYSPYLLDEHRADIGGAAKPSGAKWKVMYDRIWQMKAPHIQNNIMSDVVGLTIKLPAANLDNMDGTAHTHAKNLVGIYVLCATAGVPDTKCGWRYRTQYVTV